MKTKSLLFLLLLPFLGFAQSRWLVITEAQVLQLNGKERQYGLFDEGPRLFERNQIPSLEPQKPFHPTYNKLYSPQDFLIPLKGKHRLDSLILFDGAGKDSLLIYSGHPGDWKLLHSIYTNTYKSWRQFNMDVETEFLLLRFLGPQAEIGELFLFGEKLDDPPRPQAKARHLRSPKTLGEFMGVNAFVDDPKTKLAAVAGAVREYHNWDWHYPADLRPGAIDLEGIRFAPSAGGNWNFDAYYQELNNKGISVYPCLQGSPSWMAAKFDHKPQNLKYSADNPLAYRMHSAFVWKYVARYGSRKQLPASLNLAQGQPVKSGLNLIAGLETWNEPDKWWRGREGYFHPFEYAAMLSADFDGHMGALGPNHGSKKADPNLEFILGGLAGLDTNYIEAIRLWSKYQRPKGGFPADALNFHHYSNDAGGQDDRAKHAVSPEDDQLKQRLVALVKYRNRHLPDLKIYLSEFGYDSNPRSIQAPRGDDSLYVLEMQAKYLVRSLLLAQASGIDGAFIYMFRDVNAPNPNKYMSSGLTAEKWNQHRPKPAYYMLKNLKSVLGDFVFEEHEQSYLRKLYILRYRNPNTGQRAYVLWNCDLGSTSTYKKLYFLSEDAPPSSVHCLRMNAEESTGEIFDLEKGFKVDGSPVILIYD